MAAASVPVPRPGLLGSWDRLVGPGMTVSETVMVLAASGAGALLAGWLMATSGASIWRVGLAALIGFDVIGGAVCNGTWTTRAWYHRSGQTWVQHLGFALPHLAYVAVVAAYFRGGAFDRAYMLVFGGGLVVALTAILLAPPRLKTPVAFCGYLAVLSAVEVAAGPTPAMGWFEPALMLKLLLGHAIPNITETAGVDEASG